jgi:hypothetical protein
MDTTCPKLAEQQHSILSEQIFLVVMANLKLRHRQLFCVLGPRNIAFSVFELLLQAVQPINLTDMVWD